MASLKSIPNLLDLEDRTSALTRVDLRLSHPARFDRVARLYRAMEYLSFGPLLEHCRFRHIPALVGARRALVLGDGDGRFLGRLLASAPYLRADAIDASSAMLGLLRSRIGRQGDLHRLTTTCADARIFGPPSAAYDLVITHFFLDCLTEVESERLIARLRPHLVPGARWLVSEFQVPRSGAIHRTFACGVIASLYAAFRLLTGLTVHRIPPWRALLAGHGFALRRTHTWLGGLLVSELWELPSGRQPPAALRASTYP